MDIILQEGLQELKEKLLQVSNYVKEINAELEQRGIVIYRLSNYPIQELIIAEKISDVVKEHNIKSASATNDFLKYIVNGSSVYYVYVSSDCKMSDADINKTVTGYVDEIDDRTATILLENYSDDIIGACIGDGIHQYMLNGAPFPEYTDKKMLIYAAITMYLRNTCDTDSTLCSIIKAKDDFIRYCVGDVNNAYGYKLPCGTLDSYARIYMLLQYVCKSNNIDTIEDFEE